MLCLLLSFDNEDPRAGGWAPVHTDSAQLLHQREQAPGGGEWETRLQSWVLEQVAPAQVPQAWGGLLCPS